MKAVFLVRKGAAARAFEIREVPTPVPGKGQVLIRVAAFGLNFADVMARLGMYREAPPIPCILGYDVAGTIEAVGPGVNEVEAGAAVVGMTRFGGYAEFAVTDATAVSKIPEGIDTGTATALATQYCTAYFAAAEMVNLHPGDRVLVQSGAGGVGSALIQFAHHKQCELFATAGSTAKLARLSEAGVQHPVNYNSEDFEAVIRKATGGRGVDVIFDAVGGKSVRKGFRALAAGGRIVCFGAADMSSRNIAGKLQAAIQFGIYHPVMLMTASKSMIGINMLKIADEKPEMIRRCLEAVVKLCEDGVFNPAPATIYPLSDIALAHEALEKRKTTGKLAISWG